MDWTVERVAERLEECVSVMESLPEGGGTAYSRYWPEIIYTKQELAKQPVRKLRLRPLPDAIDRMEETLNWFQLVNEANRKLVWLRAYKFSWRDIGQSVGVSPPTAKTYWLCELENVANQLNKKRGNQKHYAMKYSAC